MAIASYSSRLEIKEKYGARGVSNYFLFEDRLYQYVGAEKVAGRIIYTYRCEEEQHTVKVYVRAGLVIDVRAFYEI